MSRCTCPVAGPLGLIARGGNASPRAGFRSVLPRKVLLAGRACPFRHEGGVIGDPFGCRLAVDGLVGVVGFFPVAPPLAWCPPAALSLPPTTPVPAKEKKKEERKPQPATGGGA
jgi:hypothetical protein